MREGVECPRCGSRRINVERVLVDPVNKRPAQESGWMNCLLATFGTVAFYALVAGPVADSIAALLRGAAADYPHRVALGVSILIGLAILLALEFVRRNRVRRAVEVFKFGCLACDHKWGFRGLDYTLPGQLESQAWRTR